jgi:FG-GAP repeat/FG-GAP-like repeat
VNRARLLSRPFLVTIALSISVFLAAHAPSEASVSSQLLIDPFGSDGDIFGSSVASVGDVNGDGYDDIVIGANFFPSEGGQGRAYLYFGGPAIDSAPDLVIPSPLSGIGWFGIGVASAGDFNGDGYPDIIVGARYAAPSGKAFIYYGGPLLDATPDVTLNGESSGSWFGNSVASAGDVNGDGFGDVIVGAPNYGSGSQGRVYVFFGGSTPDAIPDRVFTDPNASDQLGWVVGGAGDMNGDGYPDLFATAPRYYASGGNPAINVWLGGPPFDTVADLTIHGNALNDRISSAVIASDVNHDGFSDLVITRQDRAEVYLGGTSLNAVADLTIPGNFGSAAGGDENGDGADDIVLGASGDDTGGSDAGRVSVFFGGAELDAIEDLFFVGDQQNRQFGRGVATARRVDGPGPADLIVAAAQFDPEELGYDAGRVYVYANSFGTTGVPLTAVSGLEFTSLTPNPARADVSFTLALDHSVAVRITVYDLAGHEVARPIADEYLVGRVTRSWQPRGLSSGIYYVSAKLGDRQQARKLVWLGHRR